MYVLVPTPDHKGTRAVCLSCLLELNGNHWRPKMETKVVGPREHKWGNYVC